MIESDEMLVLSDGNGQLDASELLDERVAWATPVGPVNGLGRALCLDNDGDVWLGLYAAQSYYELDTQTHAVTTHTHDSLGKNAGIALGNNKVYLASYDSQAYLEFDPTQSRFSTPAVQTTYRLGIAVDSVGNIVLGRNPIIVTIPAGQSPYSYGNATIQGGQSTSAPLGEWCIIQDGGFTRTNWRDVSWNQEAEGDVPDDCNLDIQVRTAETLTDLEAATYGAVNNAALLALRGRYIEVKASLSASAAGDSPILSDLTLNGPPCDIDNDGDGDVDKDDMHIIFINRYQTMPPGDSRLDIDGSGEINYGDVRRCYLQCSRTRCVVE